MRNHRMGSCEIFGDSVQVSLTVTISGDIDVGKFLPPTYDTAQVPPYYSRTRVAWCALLQLPP